MFLCYDLYRQITAKSFPSDSHFHRCHVPCVVPGNESKTLMTPGRPCCPTHTLGWVQGDEDNPEAICRREKFFFGAKLPLSCVTQPHFRLWLLVMAQTSIFFKRWRFSFLPHLPTCEMSKSVKLAGFEVKGPRMLFVQAVLCTGCYVIIGNILIWWYF